MSAPVFLVATDVLRDGAVVAVTGAEGHHAARVRRLRAGEAVDLTDGAGLVAHGVVAAVGRDRVEVAVESRAQQPAPVPHLVVVQALPKGDRGERAVELLTEVGVDEVVPWAAERCVAAWRGERASKGLTRWRSTAREAAKQSRRWWHPVVAEPATTPEVVARVRAADVAVVLHEDATSSVADLPPPGTGVVLVVVGPEGGLTDGEVEAFRAAGATVARLGPTVLRTSTAGAVAAGVVLARTQRWSAPPLA